MLDYFSHHEVDYVVTLNTSRLWRSDIVKVLVHRELKKYGVENLAQGVSDLLKGISDTVIALVKGLASVVVNTGAVAISGAVPDLLETDWKQIG